MKPRIPGSQVAPNDRPLFTDGHTASTHSKIPLDQASAGKTYRVRDKAFGGEPVKVWGDELTWDQAQKLKEHVVTSGKSRTARVELMGVPLPNETSSEDSGSVEADVESSAARPQGVAYELVGGEPITVSARGVVRSIPAGCALHVNGAAVVLPAQVSNGDIVQAMPADPNAGPVHRPAPKPVPAARTAYRDITVRAPQPRKGPLPKDRTVSKEPVFVRLGGAPASAPARPLASPLKVAELVDGDPILDGAISDADLPDLSGDIGGGPSDADLEYARRRHGV
jgi:hypothetical protein